MKQSSSQKVSLGEKLGYSLGDAAANLVFQMMMIFQLKFYTDVFGLDGAIAGSVLMIASISAIIVDPTIGILTDLTSTRWGKFRPWIIWTAIPFCLFYMLAFYNPGIQEKGMVATYATISYVLLMSIYSFNNIPYTSLGGVMTSDIHERTSITTIRFVVVTIAQFVVQGLTLPLVDHFSKGRTLQHGWSCTIGIFACIALIFFIVTFLVTKERIQPPPRQQISIKEDVKNTVSSVSWNAMALLTFAIFITLAMWGSAMNFYFQYNVDQKSLYDFLSHFITIEQENVYSVGFSAFNMMGAVVQFTGVICFSRYLANKYGKKKTFIVCLSMTAFFTALFYIPTPTDVSLMFVLNFLRSLAYAPTIPLLWAMIGDVADHIEYESHRRATGFCFSGIVLALKLGLGFGGAIAGIIISMFGYVSGNVSVQNESATEGIRLVSSLVPALLFCVGVMALYFYPITKEFNENMQAELAARRRMAEKKEY
ncbi:glycoside/pentoside/hexuronide:cation symporter, GPH family [Xylanibacter ruminicola]|uniref:Glycoside/pentoside/hexuronide:cation symporter, GPH family n=1 Tax=Xylanibacter ruminicola TaxID=839 RepID=A0A1H5T843_XYLRU|nr:MFS transporter [Xylanibacter ruminicola]SEF59022.1 glycoside/pentoside/hexuronide:cation symporter, GPH family [Xylanibacter ruminicola]